MKDLTAWLSNSISLTLQVSGCCARRFALSLTDSKLHIAVQICDDKVFVFSNNIGQTNLPEAKLMAWNWQTGQLLFVSLHDDAIRAELSGTRRFP